MKIQLRFLKQGLVHFEVEDGLTVKEIEALGKKYIDKLSDQNLILAMSDCTPNGPNPSVFDADSFQVDAIEDEEFNLLYSTSLWDTYLGENQ